jgi:hypothetical protein
VHHKRTKHIELDIHFVREKVAIGEVRVLHVPSSRQFTDVFTKGLPSTLFLNFRHSLCTDTVDAASAGGGVERRRSSPQRPANPALSFNGRRPRTPHATTSRETRSPRAPAALHAAPRSRVRLARSLWAFGLPDPIGSGSSGNEKLG